MEKINQILEETFQISSEQASKDLTMNDVDNWDSLSHMNLIVRIEEEFKIEIDGDDIAEMITFDSIRSVVSKYLK